MGIVSGRAKVSSRGQIALPKVLREAAGIGEGDEVEVILDGERLVLYACRGEGPRETGLSPSPEGADRVAETSPGYAEFGAARPEVGRREAGALGERQRPSKVWADRVRALAAIETLRPGFAGLNLQDLWSKSRRELERDEPHG